MSIKGGEKQTGLHQDDERGEFSHSPPHEEESKLEGRFRQRYEILKHLYEERLESLTRRVQDVQIVLDTDPVLDKMKADPTTRPFVNSRSQEIAAEALASEREDHIIYLSDQVSELSSENNTLNQQVVHLSQQKRQLKRRVQDLANERNHAQSELLSLGKRYKHLEEKWSNSKMERVKEQETLRAAVRRFSLLIARNAGSEGLEDAMDGSTDGFNVFDNLARIERKLAESQVYCNKRQSTELNEKENEVRHLRERLQQADLHSQSLQAELGRAQAALSRSEEERLELRDQYMSIGTKLENMVTSTGEESKKELTSLRESMHGAETRLQHYSTLNERLQSDLTSLTLRLERKDARIHDLESRLQQISTSHTNEETNMVQMHRRQLEAEQSRYRLLADTFEEYKKTESRRVQTAQKKLQEVLQSSRTERAKWETEKDKQLGEFQEKLERQFQQMVDAKQRELDTALKSRQALMDDKQSETERVEKLVASRIQAMLKDHISLDQHKEILDKQLLNLQAHKSRDITEVEERKSREQERAIKDIEAKAKLLNEQILGSVNQEKENLKHELERLKREHSDLERILEEDRRKIVGYHRTLEQNKSKSVALQRNLKQAMLAISKLKEMLKQEKDRRMQMEVSFQAAKETRSEALSVELASTKEQLEEARNRCQSLEKDLLMTENNTFEKIHTVERESSDLKLEMERKLKAVELEKEQAINEIENKRNREVENVQVSLKHEVEIHRMKSETLKSEYDARIKNYVEEISRLNLNEKQQKLENQNLLLNIETLKNQVAALNKELAHANTMKDESNMHVEQFKVKMNSVNTKRAKESIQLKYIFNNLLGLTRSLEALKEDYKSKVEAMKVQMIQDKQLILESIKSNNKNHSYRLLSRERELKHEYEKELNIIKMELEHARERLNHETTNTTKLVTQSQQDDLHAKKQIEEYKALVQQNESKIEDLNMKLVSTKEDMHNISNELGKTKQRSSDLASTVAKLSEENTALQQQVEQKHNNLLSFLVIVRGIIPISQRVIDDIIQGKSTELISQDVCNAFQQTLEKETERAELPLKLELKNKIELENQVAELKQKVEEKDREKFAHDTDVQNLKELLRQEQEGRKRGEEEKRQREQLERQLRDDSEQFSLDLEEQKQLMRSKIESLKLMHQQELDSVRNETRRLEEQFKAKLEREKQKFRRFREDVLSSTTNQENLGGSGFGGTTTTPRTTRTQSSAASSLRPTSPFYQSYHQQQQDYSSDFQQLMQRSAALDTAAQQIVHDVQRPSTGSSRTKFSPLRIKVSGDDGRNTTPSREQLKREDL